MVTLNFIMINLAVIFFFCLSLTDSCKQSFVLLLLFVSVPNLGFFKTQTESIENKNGSVSEHLVEVGVFKKAEVELKAGTEIFTNYGYVKLGQVPPLDKFKFPSDHPWYFELKAKAELEQQRRKKSMKKLSKQNAKKEEL